MGRDEDRTGRLREALVPFERHPDLVFVVDAASRLVGQNRELTEAWAEVGPVRDAIGHALRRCEPCAFEWGGSGLAGVRSWYAAVASPLVIDGTTAGVLVSSRDITELKRSEERLRRSERMLVDTQGVAHLGTWDWDITQPTATWSDELFRIYGLSPETYVPSYEAYLTKVHPEDRQRVIDATNRVFHEHIPYSHDERIFRPDGTIRHLHTWAFPVLDEAGKLVRLIGVCQDITDRKQAEDALHQLNLELEQRVAERTSQLEAALRDLESFNSMVSHDLRSPLAVIQLGIELIEREPAVPAKLAEVLARMRRTTDIMSALVRDLLAFARVGQDAPQSVEVDVTALCGEILLEHQQASPGRSVSTRVAPDLRLTADPTLLRVALSNLLGNAWKYTSDTAAPEIEVGQIHTPDGRALFVRDNGIGFDMAESARLFRPFSRLSSASGIKGTGLGLATVQRIVHHHGGRITADAALGQGATFFVVFPDRAWP